VVPNLWPSVYIRIVCVLHLRHQHYGTIVNSFRFYLSDNIFNNKLVGITCDGASNMMGVRKGVTALFKETHSYLVAIHCLAHRLELFIKDGFKQKYEMENIFYIVLFSC
jgi:hypothetical protein